MVMVSPSVRAVFPLGRALVHQPAYSVGLLAFGDSGNYNVTFTVTDDGSPAESDSETLLPFRWVM